MAGKYLLSTLGCKVNQYESQQIRELVESFGLRPVGSDEHPEIAIVNTCAVTGAAMRKTRQAVRRSTCNGSTPVIVVGCGASADADRLSRLDGVTAVLSHHGDISAELRRLLENRFDRSSARGDARRHPDAEEAGEPRKSEGDEVSMKPAESKLAHRAKTPRLPSSPPKIIPPGPTHVKTTDVLGDIIERFADHQGAYLKVQDGCDAFCTFCTIPNLRPRLKSKPVETAVREARGLVRAGHKEIVITGVFLGAYGRATAIRRRFGPGPSPLSALVAALTRIEGLERLRLSSLEPGDLDDSLLAALSGHPTCVPHLHLPLQSGSDGVLRKMNRQYLRGAYLATIERLRARLDRPAVTTDIMVGFPGETDQDFEATIDTARAARFLKIHAFPFSPRPGTAACRRHADFVDSSVVRKRMRRLAAVERECSLEFRRSLLGCTERVIVEGRRDAEDASSHGNGMLFGRTDRYFEVLFPGDDTVRPGDSVSVRIDQVGRAETYGTVVVTGTRRRHPQPPPSDAARPFVKMTVPAPSQPA